MGQRRERGGGGTENAVQMAMRPTNPYLIEFEIIFLIIFFSISLSLKTGISVFRPKSEEYEHYSLVALHHLFFFFLDYFFLACF